MLELVAAVLVVLLGTVLVFRASWKIAEPNEATLVVGFGASGAAGGYRIVAGGGTLVIPGMQRAHRLQLHEREIQLPLQCVTWQGLPVHIHACLLYRIGDDPTAIVAAARRFLGQQDRMDEMVGHVVTGHLRAVAGALTMEQLLFDRELLAERIRRDCGADIERLGLTVDSLTIQDVLDPTGYIDHLAAPHRAALEATARVAEAEAELAAAIAELDADAAKARAKRDSEVRQWQALAAVEAAQAVAALAGPLAGLRARQAVLRAEIALATLEAERADRRLDTQVRRPADAQAYEILTRARAQAAVVVHHAEAGAAEAELDAAAHARAAVRRAGADAEVVRVLAAAEAGGMRAMAAARAGQERAEGGAAAQVIVLAGRAEARRVAAIGQARAAGLAARAAALAENAEALFGFEMARRWPQIVAAGAGPLSDISELVVLNGAEGIAELLDEQLVRAAHSAALARQAMAPGSAA